MRVLLLTTFLQGLSGSEVITLENAEYFRSQGHGVTIGSLSFSGAMYKWAERYGVTLVNDVASLETAAFDIAWCQHHVLPLTKDFLDVPAQSTQRLFVHLSAHEILESPAPLVNECYSHLTLANSEETAAVLTNLGSRLADVRIFPNPAPSMYAERIRPGTDSLKRLLVVSNHRPDELSHALQILQSKIDLQLSVIGVHDQYRRVLPFDLQWADAVITIGKTTQYALRAGRPVFCYDIHGGPGWITEATFETQRLVNFSGRFCGKVSTADTLAEDILNGFESARDWANRFVAPEQFWLESQVPAIIKAARPSTLIDDYERRSFRHHLARWARHCLRISPPRDWPHPESALPELPA